MNFLVVPVGNDFPWYRMKITLSGVVYSARLKFNTRMQRWIMDIADASNNDILNGIPVLILRDFTGQYVINGLPAGTLYCMDDTNQDTQPTRLAFGIDHTMFYADPL